MAAQYAKDSNTPTTQQPREKNSGNNRTERSVLSHLFYLLFPRLVSPRQRDVNLCYLETSLSDLVVRGPRLTLGEETLRRDMDGALRGKSYTYLSE